eukprot:CAMPEP_0202371262 /NCGR_PEP_ID=MMETSP1127-20130417/2697_1 /ASSEMBLY_ACC=CAM_ASM_000462 /TAXON_ID=3047 /ORGANISM="Dunaliella tertiolecta, Strain CCMP1320" /LENGTH=55 /DNA_ID=CAMNT_0048967445 /DNA_START=118 /DNA_END=282 /DNA_ORIENTATION=+
MTATSTSTCCSMIDAQHRPLFRRAAAGDWSSKATGVQAAPQIKRPTLCAVARVQS